MDLAMISYLSELGKLKYTEEEMAKVANEMTEIVNLMDTIKDIDVIYDAKKDNKNIYLNGLREDRNAPSMETKDILKNAKNTGNCFVVPKVVE